jgi:hypothetical protein
MPRLKYYNETTEEWEYVVVGGQGPQGPVGPEGPQGEQGPPGTDGVIGVDGEQGPPGIVAQTEPPLDTSIIWVDTDASAIDIPIGGTAGQALTKIDGTDFNTQWSDVYSQDETDTAISNAIAGLVDTAPEALDTLNELAAALGDDENFASTVTTSLSGKSDTGHTHDDRYYTETETDDLLNAKANLSGASFTGDISATVIVSNRVNSVEEGGEIQLMRSSDNTPAWKIDAYGSGSQPDLRIFSNNGDVRLRIDSNGRVATPFQPSFSAKMMNVSNVTIPANTDLPFDTVRHNIGNYFNTSTRRFTAPIAGSYFFSFHVFKFTQYSNGTNTYWGFRVNNSEVLSTNHGLAGSDGGQSLSGIFYLNAGDFVSVQHYGTMQTFSDQYNSFTGYFLG